MNTMPYSWKDCMTYLLRISISYMVRKARPRPQQNGGYKYVLYYGERVEPFHHAYVD